jgi:Rrf2 family transcriptional regulator, iron-sulfur cluster assembly transcription factor
MLCISTKGRYATRILTLLADLPADTTLSKHEIADTLALTPGYVQQLMTPLQTAGLTSSVRGKQGGFRLARSPESITVAEALRIMEGEVRLAPCHEESGCALVATCPTRPMWLEAATLFESYFRQITIADLAERAKALADATDPLAIARKTAPASAEEKGVRA